MTNTKYLYSILSVVLITLFFYSCNKDETMHKIPNELVSRTQIEINSKTISWLDNFRLDLTENRNNQYDVQDAVAGMDVILNLYKTQGVGNFIQYDIEQRDYTVPLNQSGMITTAALRVLFESIFNNNKSHYLNSTLPNKILGNINIDIITRNQTYIELKVTSVIGSEDLNDISVPSLDDDCASTFGTSQCFKSGYGDADFKKYMSTTYFTNIPLEGGGKCDGTLIGKTAAHEEVQKKFTTKIPKYVNVKNGKQVVTHMVKFVNEECTYIDIGRNIYTYNTFLNCSNSLMNDNVFVPSVPVTTYSTSELNCAYCIINNWITSVIPSGYHMSHVNIFTDGLGFGPTSIKWIVEVCWAEPVLVPITVPGPLPSGGGSFLPGPSPTIKATTDITNVDPYNNLNVTISSIINQ